MGIPPPRPAGHWLTLRATVADLALVTYAIPAERLASLLPAEIAPLTYPSATGPQAFVTAASLREEGLRWERLPWLRFTFCQLNYRTYVHVGEEIGIWFLGTVVGHRLACLLPVAWGLPWHAGSVSIRVERRAERWRYEMQATGPLGGAQAVLEPAPELPPFAPFPTREAMLTQLTDALVARSGQGSRARVYRVWHRPLENRPCVVREARFDALARWGLVTEEEAWTPHSALHSAATPFWIYLPPRPVET